MEQTKDFILCGGEDEGRGGVEGGRLEGMREGVRSGEGEAEEGRVGWRTRSMGVLSSWPPAAASVLRFH